MKAVKIIMLVSVALLMGCTKHEKIKKEERQVISPFHITRVLMRPIDSLEVGYDPPFSYDQLFLSQAQFEAFEKNLWKALKDSTTKVYPNDGVNNKPINKKKFFENAKEWTWGHLTMIETYETWYFDPNTNLIERDVLGYQVMEYVKDKQAYRILGCIFKDEKTKKKVNDLYLSVY